MNPVRAVRLLVCGSADRGDDGAALSAVAGLLAGLPPHLLSVMEVRRCEQLDLEDLLDLPEATACVITDAVIGLPVGEIVTIPLPELPARDAADGADPALVARRSRSASWWRSPRSCATGRWTGSFVGIGGRSFGFGRALGRPVRAALPAYRSAIEAALIDAAAAAEGRTV